VVRQAGQIRQVGYLAGQQQIKHIVKTAKPSALNHRTNNGFSPVIKVNLIRL
jgi:hypothetical protein